MKLQDSSSEGAAFISPGRKSGVPVGQSNESRRDGTDATSCPQSGERMQPAAPAVGTCGVNQRAPAGRKKSLPNKAPKTLTLVFTKFLTVVASGPCRMARMRFELFRDCVVARPRRKRKAQTTLYAFEETAGLRHQNTNPMCRETRTAIRHCSFHLFSCP